MIKQLSGSDWTKKRILIFSPHPDDDCIGMGATIYELGLRNKIKIIYMTPGWRGVKGKFSVEEKKSIRIKEGINSAGILGIDKKQLCFLDLPFYSTGNIGAEDIMLVESELSKFKPDIIFACGESNDPHRRHGKCLEILNKALKGGRYPYRLVFYRVWSEFRPHQIKFFLPFDKKIMDKKIEAIKAHRSQSKPFVTKKEISSFAKREEELNKIYASRINKDLSYAEVFNLCSKKI